jgi:hypothetical protein
MPARRGVERAASRVRARKYPIQKSNQLMNRHFSNSFGFWTAAEKLWFGIPAERCDGPREAAQAADMNRAGSRCSPSKEHST